MSCRKYQKWLYLNRSGELNPGQIEKLNKHIESCSSCRQLKKRITQAGLVIHSLRVSEPVLQQPDRIADKVMNMIRSEVSERKKLKRFSPNAAGDLITHLSRIRFHLATVLIFLAFAILFEESMVLKRIVKLENRMTRITNKMEAQKTTLPKSELPNRMILSGTKRSVILESINEDYIIIKKADLDHFIQTIAHSKYFGNIAINQWKRMNPEIQIFFDDSTLNAAEIRQIQHTHPGILDRIKIL